MLTLVVCSTARPWLSVRPRLLLCILHDHVGLRLLAGCWPVQRLLLAGCSTACSVVCRCSISRGSRLCCLLLLRRAGISQSRGRGCRRCFLGAGGCCALLVRSHRLRVAGCGPTCWQAVQRQVWQAMQQVRHTGLLLDCLRLAGCSGCLPARSRHLPRPLALRPLPQLQQLGGRSRRRRGRGQRTEVGGHPGQCHGRGGCAGSRRGACLPAPRGGGGA
mmetsp:Transcript_29872/g.76058  ORF Transcript_29872/g.76058 Transcript_29872/m.76058 type:complete len:218 (+) Transcript_29872:2157-2810(+)